MEGLLAETSIETAAQALWAQLAASPAGLVSIGVRHSTSEILVYVESKRAGARVPANWNGFKVRVVETGKVRPAGR